MSVKKSTIKNYLYFGRAHKDTKLKLAKKEARERDIADCLVAYDKLEKPAGTSVSMAERVYRVEVVEYFLKAGIPLHKEDDLRVLLEENGLRLSHSSHLADYIPPLLKQEKDTMRSETEGTVDTCTCTFLSS